MSLEIDLMIGKGYTLVIGRDIRDTFPIHLIRVIENILIGIGVNGGIIEIGLSTIGHKGDIHLVENMVEIILHTMRGVVEIILHTTKGMVEITHHIIKIEIFPHSIPGEIEITFLMIIGMVGILLHLIQTIGIMAISPD